MGYSCTAIASKVEARLIRLLQSQPGNDENNSSSTWVHNGNTYFFETGREQSDGAITGKVWMMLLNNFCRSVGTYRIEPNGQITRFPTASKLQRKTAWILGIADFESIFGEEKTEKYLNDYNKVFC